MDPCGRRRKCQAADVSGCSFRSVRNAARILPAGAPLYLYGPYLQSGVATAPSNQAFDESLKARNPEWGIRHLDEVTALANNSDFAGPRIVEMPANNLSVVFQRR
jgi:hypothetical protein